MGRRCTLWVRWGLLCLATFNVITMVTVYHTHVFQKVNLQQGSTWEAVVPSLAQRHSQLTTIRHSTANSGIESSQAPNATPASRAVQDSVTADRWSMTLVSEMPDTMHDWPWSEEMITTEQCSAKEWGSLATMPDVSVIITFHETETLTLLVRTVHAILQRSPPELLRQVVLVADNTHAEHLGEVLDMYVGAVFRKSVKLVRSDVSLGLIKARLLGVRHATGKVLVFMDSHMEVSPNWLLPLLYEIVNNRRTLATSYLDWMEYKVKADSEASGHWRYRHGGSTWVTYFDWALQFGWQVAGPILHPTDDSTQAVNSPITIGGMFAIENEFFHEIGAYDEGMTHWGGENIDISLRVWVFGGRVINVPCSHSAHFESSTSRSYRKSWAAAAYRNYMRVVEVWLDQYKQYFYKYNVNHWAVQAGNLTDRFALKKKATRSFQWVLDNVIPQLGNPVLEGIAYGKLRSKGLSKYCLTTRDMSTPTLFPCIGIDSLKSQAMFWDRNGYLRMPMHILTADGKTTTFSEYSSLYNTSLGTVWVHHQDSFIVDASSGRCLSSTQRFGVKLVTCDTADPMQGWEFEVYSPMYKLLASNKTAAAGISSELNKLFHKIHKIIKAKQRPTTTRDKQ